LLAASLSLLIVYDLSRDMFLEWCEYWFAGAGLKDSTGQAVLPIWQPIHAVLAAVIFCYVTIHSIRHAASPPSGINAGNREGSQHRPVATLRPGKIVN